MNTTSLILIGVIAFALMQNKSVTPTKVKANKTAAAKKKAAAKPLKLTEAQKTAIRQKHRAM